MLSVLRIETIARRGLPPYKLRLTAFTQTLHSVTPSTVRSISSQGETVGGTKTDHTKEFDNPSQSQKSGKHKEERQDTEQKGGEETMQSTQIGTGNSTTSVGGVKETGSKH